jgi:hypothetical protein
MLLTKQASIPSWENSWETSSVKEIPIWNFVLSFKFVNFRNLLMKIENGN